VVSKGTTGYQEVQTLSVSYSSTIAVLPYVALWCPLILGQKKDKRWYREMREGPCRNGTS
jgi:hypothetical protein